MEVPGQRRDTRERNAISACSQPRTTCNDWFSGICEHSYCTGRRTWISGEFIRGIDLSEMGDQLLWACFVTLCIILIVFPMQQLDAQFVLLEMDWDYWSLNAVVTLFYFGCYLMDRMLLLYAGVVEGIQTAMQFNVLGMEAVTEHIKVHMDYHIKLFLLIVGACVGVCMTLYPAISFVSWLPLNIIIGGAQQLNITASTNHFSMTMHTSLNGALPLTELIWLILGITSQCLNYIFQFIWAGGSFLLFTHLIQKNKNHAIERHDGFGKLLKSYEKFTKDVRLFIKVYYWVLWGYDRILESFPDGQDALDVPIVWFGLAILSFLLAYCFIEYSKLVDIVANWILKLSDGWKTFYGFVTLNVP